MEKIAPSAFRCDPNYLHLKRHYERTPLALYTGAGVANATPTSFGIGGWDDLLDGIAEARLPATGVAEYQAKTKGRQPWDQAQWLADRLGEQVVQDAIVQRVRRKGNFQAAYSRLLTSGFLKAAPTLGGLAAFCARLVGFSVGKGPAFYGRAEPNPRVPAVVSTNYDPYLEAAASLMFRTLQEKYLLKPVGAIGSSAGVIDQVPLFHVHGYVSPEATRGDESRVPFVDPVLTRKDYAKAWKDKAYSPTLGPQVHVLRHYSTLFVGFSFRDRWVNALLENLEVERRSRRDRLFHYALVPGGLLEAKGASWFATHGVKPIRWDRAGQIVELLGDLYCAGLRHDLRRGGTIDLVEYEPCKRAVKATGRVTRLKAGKAEFCWNALLGSRLGRMAQPPGWRPRPQRAG